MKKQQKNKVEQQALKKGETMQITKYIGLDTHNNRHVFSLSNRVEK